MFTYPGGNANDHNTSSYSFFQNYFSDLGLTQTYSGASNNTSFILFTIALTVVGIAVMLFFIVMPTLFDGKKLGMIIAVLGSIVGLFSGASYIGIAFTPANLYLDLHINFVYAAFVSFLLVDILYSIAIFLHKEYPNFYAFVFISFSVILAAYLWLLFWGPSDTTIQATGQKIVVYAEIVCMFFQGYGAWQMQKVKDKMIVAVG